MIVHVLVDVAGFRVVHGGNGGFGVVGPRHVLVVCSGGGWGRLELVLDLLEDFCCGTEAGFDAADAGASVEAIVVVLVVVFIIYIRLISEIEKIKFV